MTEWQVPGAPTAGGQGNGGRQPVGAYPLMEGSLGPVFANMFINDSVKVWQLSDFAGNDER